MTRQEAIDYIQSHSSQFKGESVESVLGKVQSSSDPDYYNPTLYVPEQRKTVAAAKGKGVQVTYRAAKPGEAAYRAPAKTAGPVVGPDAGMALQAPNLAGIKNSLPWILGGGLAALAAGMVAFRISKM